MNVSGLSVQVVPLAADPQRLAQASMDTGADQAAQLAKAAQTGQLIQSIPKGVLIDVRA